MRIFKLASGGSVKQVQNKVESLENPTSHLRGDIDAESKINMQEGTSKCGRTTDSKKLREYIFDAVSASQLSQKYTVVSTYCMSA